MDENLRSRVQREKEEHDENSILEKSFKLKNLFCHSLNSPTIKRLNRDEDKVYQQTKGMKVLDVGCGFGERSVYSQKWWRIIGIDISEKYIKESKRLAETNNLLNNCNFMRLMYIQCLEVKFDLVIGRIIHHLDIKISLLEIKRVLKKGGTAIFIEPLDANPLLKFFRFLTPFARTLDEKPLTKKDLKWISRNFKIKSSYYGIITTPLAIITSIILRPYPLNIILKFADF